MATLETVGLNFLERHRVYPGSLALVAPESLHDGNLAALPGRTTLVRAALAMARIAQHRALPDQVRAFVGIGLQDLARTPGVGLAVERQLREIERLLPEAG